MSVTFRDATSRDAAALASLGAQSFTDTFGHLYDPADLGIFLAKHSPENWAAELADPAYSILVGEQDGELVAYAKLGPPQLPFEPRGKAAELRQFYVLAPWHGAGLAPRMMDWVLATARAGGAEYLYLSVFIDNHRARRFYARYGFEEEGAYAFMVGNHADHDIVMRLAL